jgi:hypothetical protein
LVFREEEGHSVLNGPIISFSDNSSAAQQKRKGTGVQREAPVLFFFIRGCKQKKVKQKKAGASGKAQANNFVAMRKLAEKENKESDKRGKKC